MKSKNNFNIVLFEENEKVNLYSICFNNESKTEFEKFLIEYKESKGHKPDFEIIITWINKISEQGALERYFKPESKMKDGVCAIPIPLPNKRSLLRLYCLRLSDQILIIGGGGVKKEKTYNKVCKLKKCVDILSDLDFFIKKKIKEGKLNINGKILTGDLTFYLKEKKDTDEKK